MFLPAEFYQNYIFIIFLSQCVFFTNSYTLKKHTHRHTHVHDGHAGRARNLVRSRGFDFVAHSLHLTGAMSDEGQCSG